MAARDLQDKPSDDDFAGPELDALFERARAYPPSPNQLTHMLRGIPPTESRWRGRLWRITAGVAASAALIAGVTLLLAPPGQSRAFALSQVADTLRAAPVVKQTWDKGAVTWEARGHLLARRNADGTRCTYWDIINERYSTYDAERGCIMISTVERWAPPTGFTGARNLDELAAEAATWGQSPDERWERHDTVIDGRPHVELQAKREQYFSTILIDPQLGRVVSAVCHEGRVRYDYPEAPPLSIYDLGVPGDVPVVDGTASPELLALREQVVAAMARGFGAYRMVSVYSGAEGMNQVRLITDGRRRRIDVLPNEDRGAWTVDDLREAAPRYLLVDPQDKSNLLQIFDGSFETFLYRDAEGYPKSRQVTPTFWEHTWMEALEDACWLRKEGFFHPWGDRQDELIGPDERGWLGIRIRGQANNCERPWLMERWFDPQHGYVIAGGRSLNFPDAPWQLKHNWQEEYLQYSSSVVRPLLDAPAQGGESEVLEWAQLRENRWYPKLSMIRQIKQSADGKWPNDDQPFSEGQVLGAGQVSHEPARFAGGTSAVRYHYILAEPLEHVEDAWFEIPPEWLAVPAKEWP
jgi:hypothetical protein